MTPVVAHVGGIPIEEALGAFGPLLFAAIGVGVGSVRAHVRRRWREPPRP